MAPTDRISVRHPSKRKERAKKWTLVASTISLFLSNN
jgi:hypothetical protein